MRDGICNQHLFAWSILDGDIIGLASEQHSLNWCISQILDVDLFKRPVVTLNSEGMAKDIGMELFFSKDTGKQFMFYVGKLLLQRCKSLGNKGNCADILKECST